MTTQDFADKLQARLDTATTKQLKACAVGLFNNHSEGSDEAFKAVIDELEKRMPEAEFVAFLDSDLQEEA